tara:strand:+ start:14462 stop:14653 length:192 start_codon:yes stop_codon:yes gene_type:complete
MVTKQPFDIQKWQKSAKLFLAQPKWGSSPLESAHIALQRHDPELAEKCLIEAKRRRRNSYGKI